MSILTDNRQIVINMLKVFHLKVQILESLKKMYCVTMFGYLSLFYRRKDFVRCLMLHSAKFKVYDK